MERDVLKDIRLRRAIGAAIDVDGIVKYIRGGRASRFRGPLPLGMPGADPALYSVRFDPAEALRLAQAAGVRPGTPLSLIYPGVSPETDTVAQYIQAVLAPLGLAVRLERLSVPAYIDRMGRGSYDLVLMGYVANDDDPASILSNWFDPAKAGVENPARYANRAIVPLLTEAARESDPARRAQLNRAIAAKVNADLPYIYLQQTHVSNIVRKDIAGYDLDPGAGVGFAAGTDEARAMTPGELTEILRDGVARRNVPGAALGLWRQGDIDVVTAGFAELGTARPVTPHTIFRLGSISKIYTAMIALRAAMAMLDRPIVEYLADFPLADRAARDGTTLRHLLSHRAGFFGDVFDDLGADADCLSRYWRRAAQLEQVTPPGAAFSYNNAAFVLTAHLSERLLGAGWDGLFAQHIVAPFGLARTGTSRAALPGSDVAVSYIADALGRHHPTIELSAGRTMAPAGSAPWSDVPDLLRFGATLIPAMRATRFPRTYWRACWPRPRSVRSPLSPPAGASACSASIPAARWSAMTARSPGSSPSCASCRSWASSWR